MGSSVRLPPKWQVCVVCGLFRSFWHPSEATRSEGEARATRMLFALLGEAARLPLWLAGAVLLALCPFCLAGSTLWGCHR